MNILQYYAFQLVLCIYHYYIFIHILSITQDQIQKVDHILKTTKSSEFIYNISQFNQDEKLYSMNTLFPLITEYNEEFKVYYTYRKVFFNWNINSEAYRLHKQYTDFPDSSYYWVYHKGEEPKERHVLFGTFYVQHEIWKHQFPATCEDKKFLIAPLWHSGMGSVIHVLTRALAWALNENRILLTFFHDNRNWGDPEFCDADNQSIMCYLEPMTNCTIPVLSIKNLTKSQRINSSDYYISRYGNISDYSYIKYVILQDPKMLESIPLFVQDFMNISNLVEYKRWYWRIQASTFITRLNERTVNWIHEYEKEKCRDCKNEYDITLHIRHGDKGSEMKLIGADVYKEAIKILASLGMKKNYTVYVNGDDQESVDVIHTLPYSIISNNQSRLNYGVSKNRLQKHVGLISFANLYNQIRADHCIGTIASNWVRLIYELKMTVGMKSDGYIFEVNYEHCISFSHCALKHRLLNTGFR